MDLVLHVLYLNTCTLYMYIYSSILLFKVNEHLKVNPVLLDKAGHGSQKAKRLYYISPHCTLGCVSNA